MEQTAMEQAAQKKPGKKRRLRLLGLILAALLAAGAAAGLARLYAAQQTPLEPEPKPEVITVSTLEKIVQVSELSTFTAIYNGVAQVMNEEKPDQIDYYVAYEARVNAGIDFKQVTISVNSETKTVEATLPEVHMEEPNVDISSLDFIFYNKKANTASVTEAAFKACEADAKEESAQQSAILESARQNAVNVVTALLQPFIQQLDGDYTLIVH